MSRLASRRLLVLAAAAILTASAQAETVLKVKGEGEEPAEKPAQTTERRPVSAPAKRTPASRPAANARSRRNVHKAVAIPAAANTIVKELRSEFETGKLRQKSDYLTKSPNAEMTADVIAAMLNRSLGQSASMDAYIKWQLLSGIPDKMPEQVAEEATTAYRNAPGFELRPGLSPDDKKVLDRELRHVDDPADLTARLVTEARRIDILNEPVADYREELFKKLPDTFESAQAALIDLYQRAQAGVSPSKFAATVAKRISTWAEQADEQQLGVMADAVNELASTQAPGYYDTVRFDQNNNSYSWQEKRASVNDGNHIQDLAAELSRKAGRPTPSPQKNR